ncbi:hypothetical protein GALL_376840 [mine drainage metagenome]|uniref:Uncharacterized protein n=1 Tax=mine drainage metagenome TaxID=410659 RepID=A0A1J5QKS4_9ZZZZ
MSGLRDHLLAQFGAEHTLGVIGQDHHRRSLGQLLVCDAQQALLIGRGVGRAALPVHPHHLLVAADDAGFGDGRVGLRGQQIAGFDAEPLNGPLQAGAIVVCADVADQAR